MKLVDYDPLTGMKTFVEYNASDDVIVVKEEQDVTALLNRNKALYNEPDHRKHGMKECFMHAATIPPIIIHKWLKEDGIDFFKNEHWPRVQKKLNDPEFRFLRTSAGRI